MDKNHYKPVMYGVVGNIVFSLIILTATQVSELGEGISILVKLLILFNIFLLGFSIYLIRSHLKNSNKVENLEDKWNNLTQYTGLEDFVQQLKTSKCHPSKLLNHVNKSFDFMGHGSSKWSVENEDKLEKAIQRIKLKGGRARMLIFNPMKQTWDNQEQAKILRSIKNLKRIQTHINKERIILEIKLYDHNPTFRLAFWNREKLLVGHYKAYSENSNDSPMMVFNSDNEWGYYSAFVQYFNQEWKLATSVDVVWEDIKKLFKKHNIPIHKR